MAEVLPQARGRPLCHDVSQQRAEQQPGMQHWEPAVFRLQLSLVTMLRLLLQLRSGTQQQWTSLTEGRKLFFRKKCFRTTFALVFICARKVSSSISNDCRDERFGTSCWSGTSYIWILIDSDTACSATEQALKWPTAETVAARACSRASARSVSSGLTARTCKSEKKLFHGTKRIREQTRTASTWIELSSLLCWWMTHQIFVGE